MNVKFERVELLGILKMLEEKFGPLVQRSPATGKISGLNPMFLAHYFSYQLHLKFCVKQGGFIVSIGSHPLL